MSKQWHRDPNFNYERLSNRHDELTDEEIELLREKPGHLERLFKRFMGKVRRNQPEYHDEVVTHPGESLEGADFSRRNLEDADFTGSNLKYAVFTGCRMPRASFAHADLREANLAEAVLTGANLQGANLTGANLIGADFAGADLRGARLDGAYLWGADFNDADLKGATFSGAYAGGALFSHARNLSLEQFRSTIHDETGAYRLSILPDAPRGKGK